MNRVIVTNQKGGVGKTTLAREVGIALARRGYRVLLVDSDPQGNLSKSLRDGDEAAAPDGLYDAYEGGTVSALPVRERLDLVSGDARLAGLEKRYLGDVDAYERLGALLDTVTGYDAVLIDSPPSLGLLTLNGLAAATHFVVPLRPALYSLHGTNDLLASVAKVKKTLNPALSLLGVVVNEYIGSGNSRSQPVISRQIRDEIAEAFGAAVFTTVIRRTVKIEEAIASRRGVVEERTKVAEEIEALTSEIVQRLSLRVAP